MSDIFTPGLVSVTFRQYQYRNILKFMSMAHLKCVEWGSDIHVPIKNKERAERVGDESRESGISVSSYGTYYRLGVAEDNRFGNYLDMADALKTNMVRVWGGVAPSAFLTAENRKEIIEDTLEISEKSKKKNINVSVEYHGNTITDTVKSAVEYIKDVRSSDKDVYLYWQPNKDLSFDENKASLKEVCPYLSNVHVFAWEGDNRLPLYEHRERWREYLKIIADNSDGRHNVMLEFVWDNLVEQFMRDSEVLHEIIASV